MNGGSKEGSDWFPNHMIVLMVIIVAHGGYNLLQPPCVWLVTGMLSQFVCDFFKQLSVSISSVLLVTGI